MLLKRLSEYAARIDPAPPLYNYVPIPYIIELDGEGQLLNSEPTPTADLTNRSTERGQRRLAPDVKRANIIRPLLLADRADYTLGFTGQGEITGRVAALHAAFVAQVDRCATETQEPAVVAVQRFLRNSPLQQLHLGKSFGPSDRITFRVDRVFPIDLESVQAFWAAENSDSNAPVMQCVVCGQERPVLERLQSNIKGVPGSQGAGAAIISANEKAFESYGLEASLIAPTCAVCGERFTRAANHLLADEQNHIRLGNVAFIFWTREEVSFNPVTLFRDPKPEQVGELISTVRTGKRMPQVDNTAFHATVLSSSNGRIVVRDWVDTTVGEVKDQLARWFRLQKIVNPYGEEALPLGLRDLASATVRDLKDLPASTSRALLRAALTGTPLPWDLLYQAVRRNRAERGVDPDPRRTLPAYRHKRMALIKMVLTSHQPNKEEDYMVRLDRDNTDPAYLCGRLLAVLEKAQRDALGEVNASVTDRFFGTASAAPASAFGTLMRGVRSHLAKLERDKRGAYFAREEELEEIISRMPSAGFPPTLTPREQGIFSIGYYHQRAFTRAQIQARRTAERQSGDATDTEEENMK